MLGAQRERPAWQRYERQSQHPVDLAYAIQQTLVLRASRPSGTVRDGQILTFTATVRPFRPPGTHPTVRYVVYELVDGGWRLTAQRDVVADPSDNNRAKLAWRFRGSGSRWYVRVRVLVWCQPGQPLEHRVPVSGDLTGCVHTALIVFGSSAVKCQDSGAAEPGDIAYVSEIRWPLTLAPQRCRPGARREARL